MKKYQVYLQVCVSSVQLIKKVSEVGFDEPLRLGGVSKRPIIEHGYIEISTIIIEFIKNIFKKS